MSRESPTSLFITVPGGLTSAKVFYFLTVSTVASWNSKTKTQNMSFSCAKDFFKRFYIDEFHAESVTRSSFFLSSDLLPSLGARINQATRLRRYIISPFSPRYRWWWPLQQFNLNILYNVAAASHGHIYFLVFRAWEMLLVVLVIYSAWICPFEFAFLPYKQDALFIIDNIVNGFFAIDIILTFFVAYLDSQSYLLVDDPKQIAFRWINFIGFDMNQQFCFPKRQNHLLAFFIWSPFNFQVHSYLVYLRCLFHRTISVYKPPVHKS